MAFTVAEIDALLRRAARLKSGPNATFAELEAAMMEIADHYLEPRGHLDTIAMAALHLWIRSTLID